MSKFVNRIFVLIFIAFSWPISVWAGDLTSVQDVISDSRPSALPEHSFTFYVTNAVPVSGKVVITPSVGDFNIESGLSFADIDFLVDNTQKTLAASPGTGAGSAVGASITTGTSGSITFTLNNTDPISAGALIEVRVGSSTTFGGVGTKTIQLPSTSGSYSIDLKTQNSSSIDIDTKRTMIFVTSGVDVSASRVTPTPEPTSTPQGGPIFVNQPPEATSTIIIPPPTVNSFAEIAVPLFSDKYYFVILGSDSNNKLVVSVPKFSAPSGDDIVLFIKKIPKSEVSSMPLPVGRSIIDGNVYRVTLYVNGVSTEKLPSPITLSFFYGEAGFLREPVDLYRSKDIGFGWSIIKNTVKDPNSGLIAVKDLKELSLFAVMGIKGTPPVAPSALLPSSPVITSETHPDEYGTYKNSSPEFKWKLAGGIDGVSFVLDHSPLTIPDNVSEGLVDSKKYENLSDGIWYFHVKFHNSAGWGGTSHFIIQIKSVTVTPPIAEEETQPIKPTAPPVVIPVSKNWNILPVLLSAILVLSLFYIILRRRSNQTEK